ncbi:MAG TPA: hypothetical protein VFV19_18830 [Candidatus Polarisedimenticolaceae bacterium]|nr:hypothetical protein [Candidatus Polarisedimenticolaceae bacterium]
MSFTGALDDTHVESMVEPKKEHSRVVVADQLNFGQQLIRRYSVRNWLLAFRRLELSAIAL